MCLNRIERQYRLACEQNDEKLLIGSKYKRIPEGSTDRYTQWANQLTQEELYTQVNSLRRWSLDARRFQIYLAHGPTLIMPTWFCARSWFDQLGGFDEIAQVGRESPHRSGRLPFSAGPL